MSIRRAWMPVGLVGVLFLGACATEVRGPEPTMSSPDGASTTSPSFACNEQEESWITLRGQGFSPLVIDTIAKEKDFSVELPTVRLIQRSDVDGHAASGFTFTFASVDGVEGGDVKWINDEEMRFRVRPDQELVPGVYDVEVENANGEVVIEEAAFGILPRPTVLDVRPDLICLQQGERGVVIEGSDFLVSGDERPTVVIAGESYEVTQADGCRSLPEVFAGYELCEGLHIVIGADQHEPGAHEVSVENIAPAACRSLDDVSLHVVPAPAVASIAANPICTAQFDNGVTLEGTGFLRVDDALPRVEIGGESFAVERLDGCTAVDGPGADVATCTTATLTIPEGSLAAAGVHGVTLINPDPAGCESEEPVTLSVAAPPSVSFVIPQPICTAEEDQVLTVMGSDFLVIDGRLPTIHVGMQDYEATGTDGCEAVTIYDQSATVERCTELTFVVPQNAFEEGTQPVAVTNPETAACSSIEEVDVQFVAPPTLTAISDAFACVTEGSRSFTITGEGFLAVDSELPSVFVGNLAFAATGVADCAPLNIPGVDARQCATLLFDVAEGDLLTGLYDVSVINPMPAACESADRLELFIAGAPRLESADPAAFCSGSSFDGNIALNGDYFLVVDGVMPAIDVNGTSLTASSVEGCTTIAHPDHTIESCTQVFLNVPVALQGEDLTITVSNPAPADCGDTFVNIVAEESPIVASVTPLRVCTAGGTLQIDGANFNDNMTVSLGGNDATDVVVTNGGTRAVATFAAGIPGGLHTLTVANPSGCSDAFETQVRAVSGPLPFYVDPEVTWNGMSTQVTIYASGLYGGTVEEVYLIDADGNEVLLESTFDADRPNTVQAIVPAGILPDGETRGDFRFRLVDDVACSNQSSESLLTVVDELTVAVDAILPPFGHTAASTSVVVTAVDPAPAQEVQFVATPRVYLNPLGEDARARELSSVRYIDATELGGIVPEGLAVGFYEVIVINPDGTVGVADEPFQVTAEPPPLVDSVSPGAWNRGTIMEVLVTGQNFREPVVTVECFGDNITTPGNITIHAWDETTIDMSVDTNALELLSICVMRVTNTDDDTYAEYSPIAITNPNPQSGNFLRFRATTELNEARRGLVSFGGAPAREARYLYAVGGDDGTMAGAKTSGEFAALDRLGAPQAWSYLPYDLPAGRTLSQALRLDDFVYLVGGHDGEEISGEVWRAQVLNPLEVPRITNVELDFVPDETNPDSGLAAGVYYYRVAAVYAETDPVNPGGESLASDPQAVRIPNFEGVQLTLVWTAPPVDNGVITEYRVYRSLSPDAPYGDESLIGTVLPGAGLLTFVDDGSHSLDDTIQPLPLGALGKWHHVADLNVPRYSHGLASAVDPADPAVRYIYAAGGRDGTGLRNDFEFLTVTTQGPRKQTISALATQGTTTFATARAEFALLAANPENANRLSETHLFAMHGTGTNQVDVAEVLEGGQLGSWTLLPVNQRPSGETRSGYAAAVANNQVFLVGGGDNAKKNSILCGALCPPPSFNTTWTASAQADATDRVLGGYLASRGFIYTLAGNVAGVLTRTTEYSILGGTP